MGGDSVSSPASSIDDDEDLSTINQQFRDRFSELPPGGLSGKTAEENESEIGSSDARSLRDSCENFDVEANERRIRNAYAQVIKNYDELKDRIVNMEVNKSKIMSYTPGSWVENVGGVTMSDYNVPKTTTLLLIGPKGSGKSSLVNRISRVFEDDKFAPERAQVTNNSSTRDGTCFLQEYMIPRNSTSFCLYDTRSFSNDLSENLEMIKRWMTKGVCHGELVKSASDGSSLQARMKCKFCKDKLSSYERKRVDFIIFTVHGLSVLKCMDSNGADTRYTQMVANVFSSPLLSFKDHKPAIAITHGDLLSLSERARVCVYIGELLGVHPSKQTFDIPDNCEQTTELTIIDLVRYSLEHADRNLPCKARPTVSKGYTIHLWTCLLLLLLAVGTFNVKVHLDGFHSLKESVPEPTLEMKIPKPGSELKKIIPESIPKPGPEINKIIPESITEPGPEIKNIIPESNPQADPEIKKIIPENIPKPGTEIKKTMLECISKMSPEMKKVHAKRISESSNKMKKFRARRAPEPLLEIDWNKIRHIWAK